MPTRLSLRVRPQAFALASAASSISIIRPFRAKVHSKILGPLGRRPSEGSGSPFPLHPTGHQAETGGLVNLAHLGKLLFENAGQHQHASRRNASGDKIGSLHQQIGYQVGAHQRVLPPGPQGQSGNVISGKAEPIHYPVAHRVLPRRADRVRVKVEGSDRPVAEFGSGDSQNARTGADIEK